ncbi:MAG: hypothetical protein JWN75_1171 [Candidatus Saccharibacteria bacterium]|nr:hypothetical protein [Candidatus Saccharibacteria bacterium]
MPTKQEIKYQVFQGALDRAHAAASAAQVGMVEDMNAFDCGFAWVVVHDLSFMNWCRKQIVACDLNEANDTPSKLHAAKAFYGSKNWSTGWCFWKPGDFSGQSVGIHEAGARAFRDSLARDLNIRCETGTRLD